MSPVAAERLTCVTSAEVKIAWFLVQRLLTRNKRWDLDADLVGKNERQFYFVSDLRIATTSQWDRFLCASGS